jgi:hypothetical protein
VNERFTKLFQLQDPIGRTVVVPQNRTFQIVGVAKDALFLNLKEEPRPMVYVPALTSQPPGQVTFRDPRGRESVRPGGHGAPDCAPARFEDRGLRNQDAGAHRKP